MYTENPRRDVLLFVRAVLTNQLARRPLNLKLGNRSGRGDAEESPEVTAEYFRQCARDYFEQLGLGEREATAYLAGKRVLEFGPGDTLGVALVLYAHGAASVHCFDAFPLHQLSEGRVKIYQALLDGFDREQRARADLAFREPGNPRSGFNSAAIAYHVTPDGISGGRAEYDLIISRAVLGLVNRLDKTIDDLAAALKPGGVSLHKVDLSSHGLDRYRPLDFLTWPDLLYRLMYSRKGRPNRWRVDHYQALVRAAGLHLKKLEPTGQVSREEVEFLRPRLAARFLDVPPELLSWLGFWMVLEHTARPFSNGKA